MSSVPTLTPTLSLKGRGSNARVFLAVLFMADCPPWQIYIFYRRAAFAPGAVYAGIKSKPTPDVAMLACDSAASAAAVFTTIASVPRLWSLADNTWPAARCAR